MSPFDCSALKIKNQLMKEWKRIHKMGNHCGEVVELLVIFSFYILPSVMLLCVLYNI